MSKRTSPSAAADSANPVLGIVSMGLGFFVFALGDVQAKLLTDHFGSIQIVWFRQLGLCLGVLVLILARGPGLLRSTQPKLQIARGLAAIGSSIFFISALRHVPLADAVAVSFVAPFMVTVMGAIFLREPVGLRRWSAVAIGFVGVMIVIRPGMGVFHPAILMVLVAASFFALRQILSRWLSGGDSVLTTIAYTSLTMTGVTSIGLPFAWTTPDTGTLWLLILGMTICAGVGEILVIRALSLAQTVVLAPLHYTLLIWGVLYGYVIFADLPDQWTLIGCVIIMASGLYTLHREHRAARQG